MADLKNKNGQNAPEKSATAKKPKAAKVSFFTKVGDFLRGVRGELKKIVWCPWNSVRKNSIIVIIAIAIIGVIVWILDAFVFKGIIDLLAKINIF